MSGSTSNEQVHQVDDASHVFANTSFHATAGAIEADSHIQLWTSGKQPRIAVRPGGCFPDP
ncbi:MAG TPA: hypothetical protein DEP84_17905 [Chloroflexi bacterium]|nr:hypothetical protein [Chloroflexota bacterium]